MPYLDDFKQVFQNGKEIDRIYTGGSLIWKSNVEYERYNSLLEYTWREYNTTLQYSWRQYNTTSGYSGWERTGDIQNEYFSSSDSMYATFTGYTDINVNSSTGTITGVGTSKTIGVVGSIFRSMVGSKAQYMSNTRSGRQYLNTFYPIASKKATIKGTYRGTVTSTSSTTYPTNGQSGSYWYDTRTSNRVKNTYRGTVTSTSSTAYPTNGASGTYWYDTRTSEYIKGSYIDIVEAAEGTLPNGGRHTDGYWYVLKG